MNVVFAVVAARDNDVSQAAVEVDFDPHGSPVIGNQFRDGLAVEHATGMYEVDGEFKARAVSEFADAIAIGVDIAFEFEKMSGFVGVVFGVFFIGFWREIRAYGPKGIARGVEEAVEDYFVDFFAVHSV